jgi:hypothetical protein
MKWHMVLCGKQRSARSLQLEEYDRSVWLSNTRKFVHDLTARSGIAVDKLSTTVVGLCSIELIQLLDAECLPSLSGLAQLNCPLYLCREGGELPCLRIIHKLAYIWKLLEIIVPQGI